jgi:hypothetical protein
VIIDRVSLYCTFTYGDISYTDHFCAGTQIVIYSLPHTNYILEITEVRNVDSTG